MLTPPYSIKERYGSTVDLKKGYLPPLGLAYLAAVVERSRHQVAVLDLQVYDLDFGAILERVRSCAPDVLGVSALTATADRAFELAARLKEELRLPVVFGGPHVSCFSEETLRDHPFVDVVVIGEGESALVEVLDCLEAHRPLDGVAGLAFRDPVRGVVRTAPRPWLEDLDELPLPARSYFEQSLYTPLPNQYKRLPVRNMITSRGCGYGRCTYCFEGGRLGHKYRRVSAARAVEEVRLLVERDGAREISFWDDQFCSSPRWVSEFCGLLARQGLDVSWSCYARVNTVNPELLATMAAAGCWNIFFGLESGNQELLDKIQKGITLAQIRSAITWASDAGLETRGSFMFALPGETPAMARRTIDFACELPLDYAQFLLTTPFPGTRLYEQCQSEGRLNPDFREYSVHRPVFVPSGYRDEAEVVSLQKLAYRRFYFRPSLVWRHLKRIRSWADVSKYLSGVRFLLGLTS